ncbi:aspartate aminotransferase family protein [Paenirhodobacter enshiensis]|uniref:Aminotransferase n=1 Tax=Paenirhodobacter enshiensis TaxID=1105367 RepID=A0A086XRV4_9RHOB|nr:aspartate aminotransferase family protein [Paenirhodobacter enshiensis]KFI24754.1 aminotransferase [Paenirhodobacter enshiensis]
MTLANSLAALDAAHQLHPFTDARALEEKGPIIIEKGDGVRVWDSTGKEYLEGMSGLWSVALGFGEERLVKAAHEQLQKLPYYHTFSAKSHEPSIRLAEKIAEMAPEGLNHVFFTNSGSEANDTVVKLVWYMNNALGRPQKKKFLARKNAYHGITMASGSLTGIEADHTDFDLPILPVIHLTTPHFYRFGAEGETEAQFTARLLKEIEDTIAREGADTIAAFIGEPVMGAGGVLVPPAGYWPGVAEICRKNDILLIADEVINGFGRLGTTFGCQRMGFTPDIMSVSKQLTSSYMPLAAVVFSDAVYNAVADNSHRLGGFAHGFTASGHPVATAVGLENLKIIEERGLVAHAAELEPMFQKGLRDMLEFPIVGEARGVGLIGAIDLVADKATKRKFSKPGQVGQIANGFAHEEGLILRAIGDTLALCPPMISTEAEVAEMLRRMRVAVERTVKAVAEQGIA